VIICWCSVTTRRLCRGARTDETAGLTRPINQSPLAAGRPGRQLTNRDRLTDGRTDGWRRQVGAIYSISAVSHMESVRCPDVPTTAVNVERTLAYPHLEARFTCRRPTNSTTIINRLIQRSSTITVWRNTEANETSQQKAILQWLREQNRLHQAFQRVKVKVRRFI